MVDVPVFHATDYQMVSHPCLQTKNPHTEAQRRSAQPLLGQCLSGRMNATNDERLLSNKHRAKLANP